MIGDEYIQIRSRLETALFALSQLAQDLRAAPETLEILHKLDKSLREPFLFVVAGEVNAGKSSLLNALFGREFAKVDVIPTTDKIYVFKYGEEASDVHVSERLVECYRPEAFLRDFNIVDTPGTNTIVADHQAITEQFLPVADLVFFVFSVMNPWALSSWDFLKLVSQKWLKNVVFVVQQIDLREKAEVDAVLAHLDQTIRDRLGQPRPIFAVSAKKALLARTAGNPLPAGTGFEELEACINDVVSKGETRRGKLRSVCQSARVVLGDLGEKAAGAFSILKTDSEKLAQIEIGLRVRNEQSMRQIEGVLSTLALSYDRAQKRGEELLLEKFSVWATLKSIVKKSDWQREFQEKIEGQLRDDIRRQIENSVELLETDLRTVWQQLYESLQREFASSVPAPPAFPDFMRQREQLLKKLELTLLEKMSGQSLEQQLDRLFADSANWLRLPAGIAAAGGIATVVAILAHAAIIDVTGSIAAAAALLGTVVALVKRKQILRAFRERMTEKRQEVLASIGDHLRHAMDRFYQELGITFQPLQDFCTVQRLTYEPILARVKQLEETFSKSAAEIGK
jgi:small GTP-binding protein